jgi:hypothetical protein
MTGGGPKYTEFAQQAVSLADLFTSAFAKRVGGVKLFKIGLKTPDGPSTGGGRQATQHITLTPMDDSPTLVIGAADSAHATVELRSYSYLAAQHAARFGGATYPLEQDHYEELLKKLVGFFELQQYQVSVSQPTQEMLDAALAAGGGKKGLPMPVIIGGLVALLAIAAAIFLLMKK